MRSATSVETVSALANQASIPKRGGIHVGYGFYLGGEELNYHWDLLTGNHATWCRNINAIGTINKKIDIMHVGRCKCCHEIVNSRL